jgi:hypothetical protein
MIHLAISVVGRCLHFWARQLITFYNLLLMIIGCVLFGLVSQIETGHWKNFISEYTLFRDISVIIASCMLLLGSFGVCAVCTRKSTFAVPYIFLTCGLIAAEVIVASMLDDFSSDITSASNALRASSPVSFDGEKQMSHIGREWTDTYDRYDCQFSTRDSAQMDCTHEDGGWFEDFYNKQCLREDFEVQGRTFRIPKGGECEPETCIARFDVIAGLDQAVDSFCTCQCNLVKVVQQQQEASKSIVVMLAVLQILSLLVMFGVIQGEIAHRAARRRAKRSREGVSTFTLLYAQFVGSRQLFFLFFVIIFFGWTTIQWLNNGLVKIEPKRFELDASRRLYVDADHCEIIFENNKTAPSGTMTAVVSLKKPRMLSGDPSTFMSLCELNSSLARHFDPVCRKQQYPSGAALGLSLGCTNLTEAEQLASSHMCIMNLADKTFADAAYGDWSCQIALVSHANDTFPPLTVRSTEGLLYDGLTRVHIRDMEEDMIKTATHNLGTEEAEDANLAQTWSSSRYDFCAEHLRFSTVDITAPDAFIKLDCFSADRMRLVDLDHSHFHVFSDSFGVKDEADRPAGHLTDPHPLEGEGGKGVDVKLQNGDLYVWEDRVLNLHYTNEATVVDGRSKLCLAADRVYTQCKDRHEGAEYTLTPANPLSAALDELLDALPVGANATRVCPRQLAQPPAFNSTHVSVTNNVGVPSRADEIRAVIKQRQICFHACAAVDCCGWQLHPLPLVKKGKAGAAAYESDEGAVLAVCFLTIVTDSPAPAPSPNITAAPTAVPTAGPTSAPTGTPTGAPTAPTDAPSAAPTKAPTVPTDAPTAAPTSVNDTWAPTDAPTAAPTDEPTAAPTGAPTDAPTDVPTDAPTDEPTAAPTDAPTDAPTPPPTDAPSAAPTDAPTAAPTSSGDTHAPTDAPTAAPTKAPTSTGYTYAPTSTPTAAPTPGPLTCDTVSMELKEEAMDCLVNAGSHYVQFVGNPIGVVVSYDWRTDSTRFLDPSTNVSVCASAGKACASVVASNSTNSTNSSSGTIDRVWSNATNSSCPPLLPTASDLGMNVSEPEEEEEHYNHVHVEAGVFVDTVFEKGKVYNRDRASMAFEEIEAGARDQVQVYPMQTTSPSFSDQVVKRLKDLFHHDGAARPDENMVELDVIMEGLPVGVFTYYSNSVYAYIQPFQLAFISGGLLTPKYAGFELEVVDTFCPVVYAPKKEVAKEVLSIVYEQLYAALEPLPEWAIFTFRQLNNSYRGAVHPPAVETAVVQTYVFERTQDGPKPYRLITLEQAIKESTTFQLLLLINGLLVLCTAVTIVYLVTRLLTKRRFDVLLELVSNFREDLGGREYTLLEGKRFKIESQSKSEGVRVEYQVEVKTGKRGTRGDVYIVLRGHTERTREVPLLNPHGRRSFKANGTDTFPISAANVGVVKGIDIRHEGNSGGAWRLKSVIVRTPRMVKIKKPPYFVQQEFKCVPLSVRDGLLKDGDEDPLSIDGDPNHMIKDTIKDTPDDDFDEPPEKARCCGGCCACVECCPGCSIMTMFDDEEAYDEEDYLVGEADQSQLSVENRRIVNVQIVRMFEPTASIFWLVDVMLCVKNHRNHIRATVKEGEGEIVGVAREDMCKQYKLKLMNKFMDMWQSRTMRGLDDIKDKYPELKSTLQVDDNDEVICDQYGKPVGQTLIRRAKLEEGWTAAHCVTLMSDMSEAEKKKERTRDTMDRSENFDIFDKSRSGALTASELQVCVVYVVLCILATDSSCRYVCWRGAAILMTAS